MRFIDMAERITPKPNPHELDKFNGFEMGKNQNGERIQTADNVPMIEIFTRVQINRLDQLRRDVLTGRIDAPARTLSLPQKTTFAKMKA